jgi:ribonuclease HI
MKLKIYSDGGSRGNPGPAAIAVMILSEDERVLKKYSRYLGVTTNNQAEYEALIAALESASKLTSEEATCHIDSELVVKHLNGEYKVKNPNLKKLWLKVQELKRDFKKTSFIHTPRTDRHIEEVDRLVNQTLNTLNL